MFKKITKHPAIQATRFIIIAVVSHLREARSRLRFSPTGHYLDFFNNTRTFEILRQRRQWEEDLEFATK